jgi:hypothetical protein
MRLLLVLKGGGLVTWHAGDVEDHPRQMTKPGIVLLFSLPYLLSRFLSRFEEDGWASGASIYIVLLVCGRERRRNWTGEQLAPVWQADTLITNLPKSPPQNGEEFFSSFIYMHGGGEPSRKTPRSVSNTRNLRPLSALPKEKKKSSELSMSNKGQCLNFWATFPSQFRNGKSIELPEL